MLPLLLMSTLMHGVCPACGFRCLTGVSSLASFDCFCTFWEYILTTTICHSSVIWHNNLIGTKVYTFNVYKQQSDCLLLFYSGPYFTLSSSTWLECKCYTFLWMNNRTNHFLISILALFNNTESVTLHKLKKLLQAT